ncbi:hypothetical protein HZZ02_08045 [Streptococcus danieliae]|nr:hypothetical protein [Streptococcus danieliae]
MKKKNSKNPLFWTTIILGSISLILFYATAYAGNKFDDLTSALEEYSIYYDEDTKELSGDGIDTIKYDSWDTEESSSSSSYSSSSSSSSASSTTSSSSESAPFDPSQYEAVDYNAWNHDDIEKGKKIKISGKVLQVSAQDDDKLLRVAIDDNYDQITLVLISNFIYEKVIAEDDTITVYGLNSGLTSYETIFGADKTLPAMLATKYEVSY